MNAAKACELAAIRVLQKELPPGSAVHYVKSILELRAGVGQTVRIAGLPEPIPTRPQMADLQPFSKQEI